MLNNNLIVSFSFLFKNLEYKLTKNNHVQTYPFYYNQFDVSFDIRPTGTVEKYGSIIHLTRGENIKRYGDRVPAVWFSPRTRRLHICSAINGKKKFLLQWPHRSPQNSFHKSSNFPKKNLQRTIHFYCCHKFKNQESHSK